MSCSQAQNTIAAMGKEQVELQVQFETLHRHLIDEQKKVTDLESHLDDSGAKVRFLESKLAAAQRAGEEARKANAGEEQKLKDHLENVCPTRTCGDTSWRLFAQSLHTK